MHGPGPPVHGGTPTYKCVHPCAPCPLGSQGLLLLWLVALSCKTPTGGSPLPADNAKAYFKRAKAHAAVWNEREAREDFLRVAHLDPSMAAAVKKELKQLGERMRKKHVEDRKRYQGLFQPPRGPRASEGQENRQVGDGAKLQGEAPQGEAGVPENPGQGEQGAGTEEAEQPGADRTVGGEGAAPGEGTGQGQPAEVEVEARDGMGLGEEAHLGTCGAEPESWEAEMSRSSEVSSITEHGYQSISQPAPLPAASRLQTQPEHPAWLLLIPTPGTKALPSSCLFLSPAPPSWAQLPRKPGGTEYLLLVQPFAELSSQQPCSTAAPATEKVLAPAGADVGQN
ncbi:uncharacterized protein [Patagioenas fasciata]|uniref:uncharacterized protein n=1 Tax=Patagioenas fasciata TaxID=372321 RepID=UPI003A99F694